MNKFIDIHCHILPGVDDGAKNIEDSITMCKIAVENGTGAIIATPHVFENNFEVSITDMKDNVSMLQNELDKRNIDLKIYSGFECHIHENILELIKNNPEYTLCGNRKHFLLEFDHLYIPPNFEQLLFSMQTNGLQPILAHAARNIEIKKNFDKLSNFVERGLQIQLTAASITGYFGWRIKWFAKKLLKNNMVDYIASDAHSASGRNTDLSKAYKITKKIIGEDKANELFISNPQKIIDEKS